ncbi:MAG: hypothetical protein ACJ758_02905 [Actinomycetota bacterium]
MDGDRVAGPDPRRARGAGEQNLRLYRSLAGEPDDAEEYLSAMVREERLIYEFTVDRAYGQF